MLLFCTASFYIVNEDFEQNFSGNKQFDYVIVERTVPICVALVPYQDDSSFLAHNMPSKRVGDQKNYRKLSCMIPTLRTSVVNMNYYEIFGAQYWLSIML